MATKVLIHPPLCPRCKIGNTMRVDLAAWTNWVNGMNIQDAFVGEAYLTPDEREQLKSGYHPDCWDADFGHQDDEWDEDEFD